MYLLELMLAGVPQQLLTLIKLLDPLFTELVATVEKVDQALLV